MIEVTTAITLNGCFTIDVRSWPVDGPDVCGRPAVLPKPPIGPSPLAAVAEMEPEEVA